MGGVDVVGVCIGVGVVFGVCVDAGVVEVDTGVDGVSLGTCVVGALIWNESLEIAFAGAP
jgi:hypothetical protein